MRERQRQANSGSEDESGIRNESGEKGKANVIEERDKGKINSERGHVEPKACSMDNRRTVVRNTQNEARRGKMRKRAAR